MGSCCAEVGPRKLSNSLIDSLRGSSASLMHSQVQSEPNVCGTQPPLTCEELTAQPAYGEPTPSGWGECREVAVNILVGPFIILQSLIAWPAFRSLLIPLLLLNSAHCFLGLTVGIGICGSALSMAGHMTIPNPFFQRWCVPRSWGPET